MALLLVLLFTLLFALVVALVVMVFNRDNTNEGYRSLRRDDIDFDFKRMCQKKNGSLYWYKSEDPDDPQSGMLLGCMERSDYVPGGDNSTKVIMAQINDVRERIKDGTYAPKTERDRLILYFQIVYPRAAIGIWRNMSTTKLVNEYQDLEVYYNLPKPSNPKQRSRSIGPRSKDFIASRKL